MHAKETTPWGIRVHKEEKTSKEKTIHGSNTLTRNTDSNGTLRGMRRKEKREQVTTPTWRLYWGINKKCVSRPQLETGKRIPKGRKSNGKTNRGNFG